MTIDQMHPGQKGAIIRVDGEGPLTLRLMEMGFTPGAQAEVISVSPGGDPLLLRLRGYTLTIARREAKKIICQEAKP